jgi:hypothetical protein
MAKVPNDRYGSVTDLLVDLRAIRRGKPPVIAREKLSQASLEHLVAVENGPIKFAETPAAATAPAPPPKRSNTAAVVILIILLALSVILNAFFIIFYT